MFASRAIAWVAAAASLAACTSHSTETVVPAGSGALKRLDRRRRRENQARRLYHSREPQLRQFFQGYPGANTVSSGKNSKGETVQLKAVSLSDQYEIDHSHDAMFAACDGTGKLRERSARRTDSTKKHSWGGPAKNPEYVYVPHDESKPYFDMAHEWVVADKNFQSHLDESFVAHQYAIAAQAQGSVDLPAGLGAAEGKSYDLVGILTKKRTVKGASRRVSTTRRSATSSTRPDSPGGSTRVSSMSPSSGKVPSGPDIRQSNTSTTVPIGTKTSSRRSRSSSPTSERARWQTSRGSRPSA